MVCVCVWWKGGGRKKGPKKGVLQLLETRSVHRDIGLNLEDDDILQVGSDHARVTPAYPEERHVLMVRCAGSRKSGGLGGRQATR